jgi:hypothetical protein
VASLPAAHRCLYLSLPSSLSPHLSPPFPRLAPLCPDQAAAAEPWPNLPPKPEPFKSLPFAPRSTLASSPSPRNGSTSARPKSSRNSKTTASSSSTREERRVHEPEHVRLPLLHIQNEVVLYDACIYAQVFISHGWKMFVNLVLYIIDCNDTGADVQIAKFSIDSRPSGVITERAAIGEVLVHFHQISLPPFTCQFNSFG